MGITLDQTIGAFSQAVHMEDVSPLKNILSHHSNRSEHAIEVYQNNTRNAILNAMQKDFSVCAEVIGEQCFNQLVLRYMHLDQIKFYNLDKIGSKFSHFLRKEASIHHITPYLPDLCELEYNISQTLQAQDRTFFDTQAFAKAYQQQNDIVLQLAPDLLALEVNYAVHNIWHWHQQGLTGNPMEAKKGKFFLIITRHQFNPTLNLVSEPLYQLVQLLQAKLPLNLIATHVKYNQQLLEQCVAKGWVDTFYVND